MGTAIQSSERRHYKQEEIRTMNYKIGTYIYIFTPHTIEKIYERYMHASILLQHLATAPLDTRQLHELVRDIGQPPGTFVSSASSTTRRNLTLSPFQDSPASTPNISQPRSWIHADILIPGLIASPLDMPHRGGGPPPPHRLKPLLNPKTSHKFTRPPNKRKNEKKTQQLKLEELREL